MSFLVRNRRTMLLASGLLLIAGGCTTPRRPIARPVPKPTDTPPAATAPAATAPATQPVVTAPATTQTAIEPPVAPPTQPASQPTIQPEPTTVPVATTEPTPAAVVPPAPPEARPAPITTAQAAIDAGLRRMLDGLEAFSPDLVTQLSPADQQFVKATLQGLSAFRARLATDRSAATAALVDMTARLRPAEGLRIPTMTLCSRVEGFGVYETIAPQQLPAFRDSGVVLYCELQGFTSRRQELNWETRLLQQVSLLDAQGKPVWRDEPNTIVDLCRKVRRDFFIARIVRLPANLPEGEYTLRVAVEDQLSGQKTRADLPLQLGTR